MHGEQTPGYYLFIFCLEKQSKIHRVVLCHFSSRNAEPGLCRPCVFLNSAQQPGTLCVYQIPLYDYGQRGDVIGWIIYYHPRYDYMSQIQKIRGVFQWQRAKCHWAARWLKQERSLSGAIFSVDVPYWKKTKGMGHPSQVTMQELLIIEDVCTKLDAFP